MVHTCNVTRLSKLIELVFCLIEQNKRLISVHKYLLVAEEPGQRRGILHEASATKALDALTDRCQRLLRPAAKRHKVIYIRYKITSIPRISHVKVYRIRQFIEPKKGGRSVRT